MAFIGVLWFVGVKDFEKSKGRAFSAQVFPRLTDLFETAKYLGHARRTQAVKNLLPTLLVHDQPDIPKHGEVVGYRRRVAADQPRQIGNAVLPSGQNIDNQQPARMPERFEHIRAAAVFAGGMAGAGGNCFHILQYGNISNTVSREISRGSEDPVGQPVFSVWRGWGFQLLRPEGW